MAKKKFGTRYYARKAGYRSGLEQVMAEAFITMGLDAKFECEKIQYTVPESKHNYTPDFMLIKKDGGKMFIETKGIWNAEDRKKHKLIKEQHPDVDIRLMFQNPNAKISKGSKTTYAMIADKLGILYTSSKEGIPQKWLDELKK